MHKGQRTAAPPTPATKSNMAFKDDTIVNLLTQNEFRPPGERERSEEHTSELQSPDHLVCRLLLEKKNNLTSHHRTDINSCRPLYRSTVMQPTYYLVPFVYLLLPPRPRPPLFPYTTLFRSRCTRDRGPRPRRLRQRKATWPSRMTPL